MVHTKRLTAPNTWPIARKNDVFVVSPLSTGTKNKYALPIGFILKEVVKACKTNKEVKYLLTNKLVSLNNSILHDIKQVVGLIQHFKVRDTNFRLIMESSGKLNVVKLDDENTPITLTKVLNKTKVKGNKIQINLFDGSNILVDDAKAKNVKTGSSLVIKDKDNFDVLNLEKGASVLLYDGRHRGLKGTLTSIDNDFVTIESDGDAIKTLTKYCYVLSKPSAKPLI